MALNNFIDGSYRFRKDKISSDNMTLTNTILNNLINKKSIAARTKKMNEGERYYVNKNDITEREINYFVNGVKKVDLNRSNYKTAHAFHKILVDQKVNHLLGKGMGVICDNERLLEQVKPFFDEDFNIKLIDLGVSASNFGMSWLHLYINPNGDLKFLEIPSYQILPIYDMKTQTELVQLIRYYETQYVKDGKDEKVLYRVEVWDDDKVTYYQQDADDIFYLDDSELMNPSAHWYGYLTTDPENGMPHSWGKIPFICFKNNNYETTDLEMYKDLIDNYDIIRADFSNNLADVQDVVWVLHGYDGDNLSEVAINLKTKKIISFHDKEGDAKPINFEIPYQARDTALKGIKRDIFNIGMGVDNSDERFLNSSISGIAIKQMYQFLDLKCDKMERNFKKAMEDLAFFLCEYLRIFKNKTFDYKELKFKFNRANISITNEMIDNCQKSKGIVSDETILENHPFVEDIENEKKRLEDEIDLIKDDMFKNVTKTDINKSELSDSSNNEE